MHHDAVNKSEKLAQLIGSDGFDDVTHEEFNEVIDIHSQPLTDEDLFRAGEVCRRNRGRGSASRRVGRTHVNSKRKLNYGSLTWFVHYSSQMQFIHPCQHTEPFLPL
ncbi:hypothetical protein NPIL_81291 [Nephila pilipes]|uniref:Uncharacterized protein n=1 Tax=Nephila pilipes TaxID=299642 RepID=A0A8X6QBV4_NEPPI|nr:hypothetical protein NPIL_81291 [Nephila pilipes]